MGTGDQRSRCAASVFCDRPRAAVEAGHEQAVGGLPGAIGTGDDHECARSPIPAPVVEHGEAHLGLPCLRQAAAGIVGIAVDANEHRDARRVVVLGRRENPTVAYKKIAANEPIFAIEHQHALATVCALGFEDHAHGAT